MPTPAEVERERCRRNPVHFLDTYGQVHDATAASWLPLTLWPCQRATVAALSRHRQVVILKARQLGLTWLVLGLYLHTALFRPGSTVMLYSKTDEDAKELMDRIKGMHDRLPAWLQEPGRRGQDDDNKHSWRLGNGSRVLAFPTTRGDSYTATAVLLDEFDLIPNQNDVLGSVKPTVDAGGQIILLSRADKSRPESPFKRTYREAKAGRNGWFPIFLSWRERPGRDDAWHEAVKADIWSRTGSLDGLHEQYPESDTEALAPRTLDKRIPPAWLQACFREAQPLNTKASPAIPGLTLYALPLAGRKYVVGADPAEGNPTSDDSAAEVLDVETGEEVAVLAGKFEMTVFGGYLVTLATWFNRAALMVERNNHGHTVIKHVKENGKGLRLLPGKDGKDGWMSSTLGKVSLYNACADAVRNGEVTVHDFATLTQLQSIDGSTLRAPEPLHDDRADAFALGCAARLQGQPIRF